MSATAVTRANPYIGPRSFRTGEALYGRTREVAELLDLLIAERIVLLFSPSGAGKTSLVQAGLVPELEHEDFWIRPIMRVGHELPAQLDPAQAGINRYLLSSLLSLEEGLPAEQQLPLPDLARMTFDEYLRLASKSDNFTSADASTDEAASEVLIFDQFEEILTVDPTDNAAKQEFFAQVGAVLRDRKRWALFAMREDYVAGLDPYLRPIPTRLNNTYRLDLLGEHAARQAIQEPPQMLEQPIDFTDAAAQKLVDNLRCIRVQRPDGSTEEQLGPHVEPVQLQVVCQRLWDKLPADTGEVVEADITQVGDVDTALAEYYGERVELVAGHTGVSQRDIREWFQYQLITEQGIRSQVLQGPGCSHGLDNRAIWAMVDTHLVRAEKRRGTIWFELSHDRLIEPVRADNARWFQVTLSKLQREAAIWDKQHRPNGLLLRGQDLLSAERWASEHVVDVTPTEGDFLAACRQEKEQTEKLRRLKRKAWTAVTAAVLVAMVASGIVAVVVKELGAYQRVLISDLIRERAKEETAKAIADAAIKRSAVARESAERFQEAAKNAQEEADNAHEAELKELAKARRYTLAAWELRVKNESPTAMLAAMQAIRSAGTVGPQEWNPEQGLRDALAHSGGLGFETGGGHVADVTLNKHWLVAATVTEGGDEKHQNIQMAHLWNLTGSRSARVDLPGTAAPLMLSPDGHWLVTAEGSNHNQLLLWDLKGQHRDPMRMGKIDFNPTEQTPLITADSQWLITSDDGIIKLWDLKATDPHLSGEALPRSESDAKVRDTYLAASPDGHWLVTSRGTSCTDSEALLWDLRAAPVQSQVLVSKFIVVKVAFSSDAKRLVVASNCSPPRGRILVTQPPDSKGAGKAEADSKRELWNLEDLSSLPLNAQSFPNERLINIAISSDHHRVIAEVLGDVWIWDADKNSQPAQPHHLAGVDFDIALNQDGTRLFGFGIHDEVHIWTLSDKNSVQIYQQPLAGEFVVSRNGRWAMVRKGSTATVFDLAEKGPTISPPKLLKHQEDIASWDFSPDGDFVVTGSSEEGTARLWDLTREPSASPIIVRLPGAWSASPDGQYVANGTFDGTLRLLAVSPLLANTSSPAEWKGHTAKITGIAFSPDNKHLATAAADGTLKIWNIPSLHGVNPSPAIALVADNKKDVTQFVTDLKFSGDGHWLATNGRSGSQLWNLLLPGSVPRQLGTVRDDGVAFSADGKWLAVLTTRNSANLWSLNSMTADPRILNNVQTPLLFSPTGRWLITGSNPPDGAKLWDLRDERIASPHLSLAGQGSNGLRGAAFSTDGHWLVTAGNDGVQVWDFTTKTPPTAQKLAELKGDISDLKLSPDSSSLVTRSGAGMQLWHIKARPSALPGIGAHGMAVSSPILLSPPCSNSNVVFTPYSREILCTAFGSLTLWSTRAEEDLFPLACRTAGRNLTRREWNDYFYDEDYCRVCPEFPPGAGVNSGSGSVPECARSRKHLGESTHKRRNHP